MQLVEYGVIPVLIDLLKSPEESVQFYTAAALSNIVVEGTYVVVCNSVPLLQIEYSRHFAVVDSSSS